ACSGDSQTLKIWNTPSSSPAEWKMRPPGGLSAMPSFALTASYCAAPTPSGSRVILPIAIIRLLDHGVEHYLYPISPRIAAFSSRGVDELRAASNARGMIGPVGTCA